MTFFETVLVSANDYLVDLFLKRKINFLDISKMFSKVVFSKEFSKYKKFLQKP